MIRRPAFAFGYIEVYSSSRPDTPDGGNATTQTKPGQLQDHATMAEPMLAFQMIIFQAKKTNDVGDAFAGAARSTVGVEAADSTAAVVVSAAAALLVAELEAADVDAADDSAAAVVSAGAVAFPPAGASAAGGAAAGGGPPAASSGGAGVKAAWSRAILPAVPPTTSVPSVDFSVAWESLA